MSALFKEAQKFRKSVVATARTINASLDFTFYDISALTPQEHADLSALKNPEGSIVVVYPANDKEKIVNLTPFEFIKSQKATDAVTVDSVVIAGVGSSALGTAALARNVADFLGRPVAGIVSGFGLADLVTEALGGWFVLGYKNAIRDNFAKLFDALEMKDHVWDDTSYSELVRDEALENFNMDRYVYGSPDSAALLLTLYHLRDQMKAVIGHSKGNYIIENALEGLITLCDLKKCKVPQDLNIVTLGATIRFPEQFKNVAQFIGGIDMFGMMNSRPGLDPHVVSWAWHSLNEMLPANMSVSDALAKARLS